MSSPAAAAPGWCLPGLFESGSRLHPVPTPDLFWLEPLLRQHALCRHARDRPGEQRVLVIGNSGPFGFPLPANQAAPAELDRLLVAHALPARAFNLGFIYAYQLRDALIVRAALSYDPAVIVYPVTITDFIHVAPIPFIPALSEFFRDNAGALEALAADPIPGLAEPIARYNLWLSLTPKTWLADARLRQLGAVSRAVVRAGGEEAIRLLTGRLDGPSFPPAAAEPYNCAATLAAEERDRTWASWNILAYLEELRRTRGIDVVVAHWPTNPQPSGACYNGRTSVARLTEFLEWLRAESAARGFEYVDLHDLLGADDFVDSIHLTAEGNRRVAAALAPVVEAVVRRRASR